VITGRPSIHFAEPGSGSPFGTPGRRQRRVLCRSVEDVTSTALRPFVLHNYAEPPQLSNIRICRDPCFRLANHLADECRATFDEGHHSRRSCRRSLLPNLALMDQGAPSARGAGVRMRPPAVHRPRPLSVSFLSNSIRLRRGPHDSGMRGRFWPAVRSGVRGASSRLPLSPVRTYQEPPEGPRSFVQRGAPSWPLWRLLIALRVG